MNKTLYLDTQENSLRISSFDHYHGETLFNQLAAKFVIEGSETYYIGNKKYSVKQGEYILGNNNLLSEVKIQEKTLGLCLDISDIIISEIIETLYVNPDLKEFLLSDKFLVNKYKAHNTTFGHRLQMLSKSVVQPNVNPILVAELFYGIGESIVFDQTKVFEQYAKLKFQKQEVQKDVFRNLLNTKNFIDDCFLENLNLQHLQAESKMSKFAFIRLFKKTFGISPYQYILNKRLVYAMQELKSGKAIGDIASITGFADTPSFSKAFKQLFGFAPSKIKD